MVRLTTLASVACLFLGVASAEHVQPKIRRGEVKVRGVNLGGWLVAEHWMSYKSPAWTGVNASTARQGEWKTMEALGHGLGDSQFDAHRRTWITRKDIAEIASYGLNTVRVPVGHWIVNGDASTVHSETSKMFAPEEGVGSNDTNSTGIRTALSFLDELVNQWALELNVSVLLSLHAHQGSQNGYDHSAPYALGEKHWADNDDNYRSSIQFARFLAARYQNAPAFLGMNLMNEPHFSDNVTSAARVREYYEHAYKLIRDTDNNDCVLVVSPNLAEQTPPFMMQFMRPPLFKNVWHEFHRYYTWGFKDASEDELVEAADAYAGNFLNASRWQGNPVLVGEWSLNGGALGVSTITNKEKLKAFAKAQLRSYEHAGAGWTFWSWRHDDETATTSGWSMRQLLRAGDLVLP